MLPRLNPLTFYDRQLVASLVNHVVEFNHYKTVQHILKQFISKQQGEIDTGAKLSRQLEGLSNVVFNHVVSRFRELRAFKDNSIQTAFHRWSEHVTKQRVRFVWLLIERGEVTLLSKSALYYEDISQCLTVGWRYKPSVDYIDSRAFDLLSYEVQAEIQPRTRVSLSKYHPTFTVRQGARCGEPELANFVISKGTRYNFQVTGDHVTVKMPWHVSTCCNRALNIFYVHKYDTWVYSYDSSIQEAAHQLAHY